jgi:hypothetical protein
MTVRNAPVSLELAPLMERGLVTAVGIPTTDFISSSDVTQLLQITGLLDDVSRWILADLLVWGDKYAAQVKDPDLDKRAFWKERDAIWEEMLEKARSTATKHTVYNMVATAKAFPHERRRNNGPISFEHHRLLVGMDDDAQENWLDMAEAGEWGVKRLRRELYANPATVMPTRIWTDEEVLVRLQEMEQQGWFTVSSVYTFILELRRTTEYEQRKDQASEGDSPKS